MRKIKNTAILLAILLSGIELFSPSMVAYAGEKAYEVTEETDEASENYDDYDDYDDYEEPSEADYAKEHWYDDERPESSLSDTDPAPDGKAAVKGKTGKLTLELTKYNKVKATIVGANVTKKEVGSYLYGYSYYYLYRAESPNGPFLPVDSDGNFEDYESQRYSLSDYNLKRNTTYYYKVRQKYVGYNSQENRWYEKGKTLTRYFDSDVVSITTLPDKEVVFAAEVTDSNSAKLSWDYLDEGVESYTIYRAEGDKNGTYLPIKTVNASEENRTNYNEANYTYNDTTLAYGTKYFYKVSAHTIFGLDTPCDVIKNVLPGPNKVVISKMKCPKSGSISLQWKKVDKATGYVIYRSTDNVNFKKIKTISNPNTTSVNITGCTHGTVYYFKIKAFDNTKGSILWGVENESKSKTMDYYLCPASDLSREERFGNLNFKNQKQAEKQMKTIRIKVWDINKKTKKKYTRYFYLTVHKNAAPTVKKIFDEIYKGKEKFPIHSIGGYAWRSNSSTSEHHYGLAIDINPEENWMPSRKVGKYWRPGKDPYSITPDGDVVTIMKKYGFYWLGEYDAMHFSVSGR